MKLKIIKDGNGAYRIYRKNNFWTPWQKAYGREFDFRYNMYFPVHKEFWNISWAEDAVKEIIEGETKRRNAEAMKPIKEYVITFNLVEEGA